MANLDFLAAGVEDTDQWTTGREAKDAGPNPFTPKLRESWDNRQTIAGKVRGAPKSVKVQTLDQYRAVRTALTKAQNELNVGLATAVFGPERDNPGQPDHGMRVKLDTDALKDEEGWAKNSGGDVLVKFRAQPKRGAGQASQQQPQPQPEPEPEPEEEGDEEE